MSHIDLAPLVNGILVPLLTPVLLALASYALAKVAGYAHFQVSAGQRQVVEDAIRNGIAYAAKTLPPEVSAQAQVATAASYVLPKIPGALKFLGIDGDHLADLVKARLPQ